MNDLLLLLLVLETIGDVPREFLEDVFRDCTWKQLVKLEHFNEVRKISVEGFLMNTG